MNSGFLGYLLCLHLLVDSFFLLLIWASVGLYFSVKILCICFFVFWIFIALYFKDITFSHYICESIFFSLLFDVCNCVDIWCVLESINSFFLLYSLFQKGLLTWRLKQLMCFSISFVIFFPLLTFGHLLVVLVLVSGSRRPHLFPSWWITSGSFSRRLPSHLNLCLCMKLSVVASVCSLFHSVLIIVVWWHDSVSNSIISPLFSITWPSLPAHSFWFYILICLFVYIYGWVHVYHRGHIGIRGQLTGVGSLMWVLGIKLR